MNLSKPYSESCDQNREPILKIIQPLLVDHRQVLEIGSGTGQHAVAFASAMPHLVWHTSDKLENHAGINMWLTESELGNVRPPITLDVLRDEWPELVVDAVFSANTIHIMHWVEVEAMFEGLASVLGHRSDLLIYGPFNYNGDYTSDSNARFDVWLKDRDPLSGIKHFEEVNKLASKAGINLVNDFALPANNRILHWQKS